MDVPHAADTILPVDIMFLWITFPGLSSSVSYDTSYILTLVTSQYRSLLSDGFS